MLSSEEINNLISKSISARENAFAPRSDHKIGACVLMSDGSYFEGCNIEGIISGLGVCAERAAIDHAVLHGKYEIKAICTVDAEHLFPCGVCLQYLFEFLQINNEEITVIASDIKRDFKIKVLTELLPNGYLTKNPHNLENFSRYKGR